LTRPFSWRHALGLDRRLYYVFLFVVNVSVDGPATGKALTVGLTFDRG
jgi:hypothetical protein